MRAATLIIYIESTLSIHGNNHRSNLMTFTLFIDESGEAGIKKIRSKASKGASPYFVLGAALIQNRDFGHFSELLKNTTALFGKNDLHCNKLMHRQKVKFAQEVASLRLRAFSVISYKHTLSNYSDRIEGDPVAFYNKCASYLLECVGEHLNLFGIQPNRVKIVFEKGPTNYDSLRSFIAKCQRKPIYPRTKLLKYVEPNNIIARSKSEEPLLQVADLVAHALYSCVDKTSGKYHVTEARYLMELKNKFYHDPVSGLVLGKGIKAIHSANSLKLDDETTAMLRELAVDEGSRFKQ